MWNADTKKLLIFDLDDTLIDTSDIYWQAKKQFINTILSNSKDLSETAIDNAFEEIDSQNLVKFGYSPERYGKSMFDTYIYFIKKKDIQYNVEIEDLIIKAGNVILNKIPVLIEGSIDLLSWCRNKFKLALVTRGEESLQEKKIHKLGLEKYFDLIKIVSQKDEQEFRQVIEFFNISANSTWIIGDSLKAEIETGLRIGANCIFFNYTHASYKWIQERNYSIVSPSFFYKVDSLDEIPLILEQSASSSN
jgi:putative hydrolase of the HAD superfamily